MFIHDWVLVITLVIVGWFYPWLITKLFEIKERKDKEHLWELIEKMDRIIDGLTNIELEIRYIRNDLDNNNNDIEE